MSDTTTDEVFAFWEDKYGSRDGVWSGRVNAALADVAEQLPVGRALDLGCGEGGDALWLAERGWSVVGIDVSPTALARAEVAAERAGLSDRITWVAEDLDTWSSDSEFDLVAASFLQSPVPLDRGRILRAGAERVAPGGHLLVVAHAEPPPWAGHDHDDGRPPMDFPSPESDVELLALAPESWETVVAERRDRRAFAPDGAEATLRDSVVLVRRTA